MNTTTSTKKTTRQHAAKRDLQAEFARDLEKLTPKNLRYVYGMVVGFWLLERPQYLEQVQQWMFEERYKARVLTAGAIEPAKAEATPSRSIRPAE